MRLRKRRQDPAGGNTEPPAEQPPKPARRRTSRADRRATPRIAQGVSRIGGGAALLSAEVLSAQPLNQLAIKIGWPEGVAWLLPIALDLYAAVSVTVGYVLPQEHPSRGWATRNARLALGLTVGCNALYHLLVTHQLGLSWPMVLAVSVLPPFVAERLINLGMQMSGYVEQTGETVSRTASETASGDVSRGREGRVSRRRKTPVSPETPTSQPLPAGETPAVAAAETTSETTTETPRATPLMPLETQHEIVASLLRDARDAEVRDGRDVSWADVEVSWRDVSEKLSCSRAVAYRRLNEVRETLKATAGETLASAVSERADA